MKNIIRKSAIAASLIIALAVSTFQAHAQTSNVFIYDRTVNSSIGISSDNAIGCSYEVKDKKGNVVMSGKIKSSKLNIPTAKLNNGTYHFSINGNVLQQFAVK